MNKGSLTYHLCPTCGRATPAALGERHCPNDGSKLLSACPRCGAPITTPYTRYCTHCGEVLLLPSLQRVVAQSAGRQLNRDKRRNPFPARKLTPG